MVNDKMEFVTTPEYGVEDVKKVQEVLLIMADHVHHILESHNIKYFVTFGTLLGAVRHEGFVPWDDDIDLFLFEEEYDYALECLRKELPSWMIVHDKTVDPIYWPYWSRLRDLNSEARASLSPDSNNYKYRGINLDLYKLKRTKKSQAELELLKENLAFWNRKHSVGLVKDEVFQVKTEEIRYKIANFKSTVDSTDDEDVYYFVILTKIIEMNKIFPLKKYKFEGREYWGPNNAHALLTQAYGDYMKIPELEKRKTHYSKIEYKNPNFDYKNEK